MWSISRFLRCPNTGAAIQNFLISGYRLFEKLVDGKLLYRHSNFERHRSYSSRGGMGRGVVPKHHAPSEENIWVLEALESLLQKDDLPCKN